MKQIKFFGLAAIVCGMALSMTSCNNGNNDNPILPEPAPETVKAVLGFEGATLNADGY